MHSCNAARPATSPTAPEPTATVDTRPGGYNQPIHRQGPAISIRFNKQVALENIAGNSFLPGVSSPDQIADPKHPCKGAVPQAHSHYFTADGQFGSKDHQGEQVDDGTYKVVDDRTFVVSKEFPDVTFHYRVSGDTIRFDPVVPSCAPGCFEAVWSVMVAFPGKTWERVS